MFEAEEFERLSVQLQKGLDALELPLSDIAQEKCLHHIQLLSKWNRAYNLTSVREPREMIARHVLDSLSITWFVRGQSVLDMGTGAGFPGIPIAIACQDKEVVLADSSAKKIDFIRHVAAKLRIRNVQIVHGRVDSGELQGKYESILCRALGSLKVAVEFAAPLLHPEGAILAMKGKFPDAQVADLPPGWDCKVHRLAVPELEESRYLIVIKQITEKNKQY